MISNSKDLKKRIRSATVKSPIIVYKTGFPHLYDSRFADTVVGKQHLKRHLAGMMPNVIGIFHNGMESKFVDVMIPDVPDDV
jgi:hypothetical protein